jgi:hypothetical protein
MKKVLLTMAGLAMGIFGFSQAPGVINFEYMNGHTPAELASVDNNYFNLNYGVIFSHTPPGIAVEKPIYAKVGAPAQAFLNTSTYFNGCNISGSLTDDYPYASAIPAGCYFLTDDAPGVMNAPKDLYIIYDQTFIPAAHKASGLLYDIDGNESWKVTAYDEFGTVVNVVNLLAANYGDGTSAMWTFNSVNKLGYIHMEWTGSSTTVGVAFDNFYYNSIVKLPCNTQASFGYTVNGCGVQFSNQSTTGSGSNIIGYEWTFTDLATGIVTLSNDENPFKQFTDFANVLVELNVIGYNGKDCCEDKVSREIQVEECRPCDATVAFRWHPNVVDPCFMTFDATVTNNTTAIAGYYWEVKDLSTGTTVIYTGNSFDALVPSSNEVCLTVIFMSQDGTLECCTQKICANIDCGKEGETKGGKSMKTSTPNMGDLFNMLENNTEDSQGQISMASVYPNPSDELLNVEVDLVSEKTLNVDLISTNGQVFSIKSGAVLQKGNNIIQFETSSIPTGLYIIRIQNEEFSITKKISISHK